jgi:hypothetical protein
MVSIGHPSKTAQAARQLVLHRAAAQSYANELGQPDAFKDITTARLERARSHIAENEAILAAATAAELREALGRFVGDPDTRAGDAIRAELAGREG